MLLTHIFFNLLGTTNEQKYLLYYKIFNCSEQSGHLNSFCLINLSVTYLMRTGQNSRGKGKSSLTISCWHQQFSLPNITYHLQGSSLCAVEYRRNVIL